MYDGRPSPPPDVASPSGRHSVSSAESSGSRIAPDLGGSSARYFPMRSVMYPSSGKAGSSSTKSRGSRGSQGATSARSQSRSLPPGSAEAILTEEGFPDEDDARVKEGMSDDAVKHGAENLGIVPRPQEEGGTSVSSAERPSGPRRSSSRTEGGGGGSQHTVGTPTSDASSDVKPPSLDPFLPEPTTHAKIGDPDSDEEEYDGDEDYDQSPREPSSKVQEQDFADPSTSRRTQSPRPPPTNHSTSLTGGSSSSERPMLMTSRFEHKVTEDGQHLVITGREGELERCEDEVRSVAFRLSTHPSPALTLLALLCSPYTRRVPSRPSASSSRSTTTRTSA